MREKKRRNKNEFKRVGRGVDLHLPDGDDTRNDAETKPFYVKLIPERKVKFGTKWQIWRKESQGN